MGVFLRRYLLSQLGFVQQAGQRDRGVNRSCRLKPEKTTAEPMRLGFGSIGGRHNAAHAPT